MVIRPGTRIGPIKIIVLSSFAFLVPAPVSSQFTFNFSSSGSVVASVANTSCNFGGFVGGMMGGGGMGQGGGACDSTVFLQEVTTIGGNDYYHIAIGDGTGDFGLEYYIGTVAGNVCWFGCGAGARTTGMNQMGGGGISPLSSSSGASTNATDPLLPSNDGVGNPNRAAIYMFNIDTELNQEFLKSTESQKPVITQTVSATDLTINFQIDMTNSTYNDIATPGILTLTQSLTSPGLPPVQVNPGTGAPLPDSGNFNITDVSATATSNITGGRYTYSTGTGDGGSLGTYTYFEDTYNVYTVDWASFCDPVQNPASNCVNFGGAFNGGMMGGGMGMMGGGMGMGM